GPFRADPAALLEPMQRRVKRALLYLEHSAGHLLQALRDRIAGNRAERNHLEDQPVEGALQKVRFLAIGSHTKTIYMLICRVSRYRPAAPSPRSRSFTSMLHR